MSNRSSIFVVIVAAALSTIATVPTTASALVIPSLAPAGGGSVHPPQPLPPQSLAHAGGGIVQPLHCAKNCGPGPGKPTPIPPGSGSMPGFGGFGSPPNPNWPTFQMRQR
jgi:hypothetical protein